MQNKVRFDLTADGKICDGELIFENGSISAVCDGETVFSSHVHEFLCAYGSCNRFAKVTVFGRCASGEKT